MTTRAAAVGSRVITGSPLPPAGKKKSASPPPWLLLLPLGLWMVLFQIVPLVLIVAVSFMSRGSHGPVAGPVGLHNYLRFADPLYWGIMADSFKIAGAATALCLVIGYPFAYHMAIQPARRRNRLLLMLMLPFWTNMLIRTYAWMTILRGGGIINTVLLDLNVIHQPLEMLHTEGAALLGLVYTLLPFMVLPLYASLEKLDRRLLLAAEDLGANPFRTFFTVTLPLTAPGIGAGGILVFVPSLALFYMTDLLGGARVVMMGSLIQRQFTQARNWPFGSAASVILIAVSLLLIAVSMGLFMKGPRRRSRGGTAPRLRFGRAGSPAGEEHSAPKGRPARSWAAASVPVEAPGAHGDHGVHGTHSGRSAHSDRSALSNRTAHSGRTASGRPDFARHAKGGAGLE